MTVSDDFKSELKQDQLSAQSVSRALKMALAEAIELQITTWVVSPDEEGSANAEPRPGHRMQTRINIVDGDINNEIGSTFLNGGPHAELRDFHLTQVQESREILQKNLENLQRLFGILVGSLHQLSKSPNSALEPTDRNLLNSGNDSEIGNGY